MPKDYQNRLDAALPGNKNIIVEAGAGTGKTTLLTERLCYLILGKGLRLDQIVALTFTDKAAAEIKLRVLQCMNMILEELSSSEIESQITKNLMDDKYFSLTAQELKEAKERNITQEEFKKQKYIQTIQNSFELIERAQICTIHSFALQLLRLYPLEAGLAPQVEVDTGFIFSYIFNKNWSAFLEEELVLTNPRRALWEKLLSDFSLEELKTFALTLSKPYFNYCKFSSSKEEINSFFITQLAQAKALLDSKQPHKKVKLEENLKEAIKRLETLSKNFAVLNKEELLKLPVQEELEQGGKLVNWTKEETQQANDFIALVNTLTPCKIDLLEQAYNLFSSFAQRVEREMRSKNVVSYDKSILLARDLVQNNLAVRKDLKKRYKSLMIDEFQDTDMAQGQLMLFLAEEENSSAKNWEEVILEQGKLFVVGDPKQSIYRFRGANISAYQKFLELMQKQNAQTCFLTTNFRSQENIIKFVNKWGACAIKYQPLIQAPYIPLEVGNETKGSKPKFLYILSGEKNSQEDLRINEANILAAWIKENVGTKKLVKDKILSYKDITVLYSAGTGISIYTDALKRLNIPYNLEASGNFYEAQEVLDIINILRVIYDPQDKLALIGVLRSPLCAMKDEELIDLWQQKALNIFAKDFKASVAVKKLYQLLISLNAKAGRLTLKELLEEIFYETDFPLLETLANASDQALANLNKFKRVALENASLGFTLGQFLFYIQAYARQEEEEGQTSFIEENFDVVNLMSIHKAKGLQAPVVILIDTGHKENTHKEQCYIDTLEGKIGLSLGSLKNLNYFILQEKETLHKKAERERLLYVALTRAEQELLIFASQQETQGVIEKSLRQAGCYPSQENSASDFFETLPFTYKDPQSFMLKSGISHIQSNNLDFAPLIPVWQERKAEFATYAKQEILAPSGLQDIKKGDSKALDIGSLVHKTLNLYFQQGKLDLLSAFTQLGFEDRNLLNPCQKIIDNFEKSTILKELKKMQFLGSEIPFSMYENGVLVNGVIDALFQKSTGELFIVDFKTDKIDIEGLKASSLKYEQQMALYKRAVQKMFKNQKVCSYLAYLHIDRLFEL